MSDPDRPAGVPYGRPVHRPLELQVRRSEPDLVVDATGDLDATARPALEALTAMARTGAVDEVLLDLSGVTSCDADGFRALCEASAASAAACRRVTIRPSEEIVRSAWRTDPDDRLGDRR